MPLGSIEIDGEPVAIEIADIGGSPKPVICFDGGDNPEVSGERAAVQAAAQGYVLGDGVLIDGWHTIEVEGCNLADFAADAGEWVARAFALAVTEGRQGSAALIATRYATGGDGALRGERAQHERRQIKDAVRQHDLGAALKYTRRLRAGEAAEAPKAERCECDD